MTTFVLVHGAWHGGWCWRRVRDQLEALGHTVYTPTLTGLGERAHLAAREVGLETHIQDVIGVLAAEDLNGVILVGHSYSGLVITAVADRAAERIVRVVYLDAVVPRDGECLYDRAPPAIKEYFETQANTAGDGWLVPATAAAQLLGLTREEDVRWVMPRLTPHPIRTFRDPARLRASAAVPRTYINCIGDKPLGQPRTVQAQGIDDYHEIQTGHDAMVTKPHEVAALLIRAAETR